MSMKQPSSSHPELPGNLGGESGFDESVSDRFATVVDSNLEAPAIAHPTGKTITYNELQQAAAGIATRLLKRGHNGVHPVGIAAGTAENAIVGMVGALMAGRPFVTLDMEDPARRLEHILGSSGVRTIVSDSRGSAHALASAVGEVDIVGFGSATGAGPRNWDHPSPDAVSHILYTSGSTGLPKGVVHSQRNLIHKGVLAQEVLGITSSDRVSLLFSPSTGAGISDIFGSLINGAAVCPYDLRSGGLHRLGVWLDEMEITVLHTVPTVLRRFLESIPSDAVFSSVRCVVLAGEPMFRRDVQLFRRHFSDDCVLVNRLSSNETHVMAVHMVDRHLEIRDEILPVGRPVGDKRISLVDSEGNEVGEGEIGQIVVESRYLALGYWRNPELTKARFSDAPGGRRVHRTGDLGRLRPDGLLEYVGRTDDRMKIHGHTVEPREVERALQTVHRFKELAVVGRRPAQGPQQIVAYLVPESAPVPSPAQLRSTLSQLIPDYMIPSVFVTLDALPLTPLGKVDRRSLTSPEDEVVVRSDPVPPRNDTEATLVNIWQDVLGLQQIGVEDDFFELGGTSMQALQVFALIARRLDVDMPSTTLLQAPTVATLAAAITEGSWGAVQESLVLIRGHGSGVPFFCIHGGGGGVLFLRNLVTHLSPTRPIYGLQARGFEGRPGPYRTVEELAAQYLEEVRSPLPTGPYLIGGLSFGGKVAYEMARQLVDAGDEVALVVLFDTQALPTPRQRGPQDHLASMRSLSPWNRLRYITRGVRRRVRRVAKQALLRYYLWRGEKLPDTFGMRNFYFYPMHAEANREYQPLPYPGELVIIGRQGSAQTHRETWGALVDGVVIHEIEGGHHDLMNEPHVADVAQHLQRYLDMADNTETPTVDTA